MATIYKKGSWAENGRIMPGQRTKEKHIDQLLIDGSVIDKEDQKFSPKEFKAVLLDLFPDSIEKDGRIFLEKKAKNGKTVGFYTRNIYHLGGDWSSEKKRIEIGKDFLDFYQKNKTQNIKTILLGCYHYYPNGKDGVILFVCFSADTYATRELNNSAAHIHTLDLQNALQHGLYRRLDKSANELLVLDKAHFVKHINRLRTDAEELEDIKTDKQLLDYFGNIYKSLPRTLNGIQCYEEMFDANDQNRKQGAWEGWYIEYYVKKYLREHPTKTIEWWSSKKKEDLDFDLRFLTEAYFYGDVKSDDAKKSVQGNKKSNVDILVKEHNGRLWYVVFEFVPEKDSEHEHQTTIWWNKKLGKSDLLSYATRMKYAITLHNLSVYEINQFAFKYLKEFAVSPCDGKPRELKYRIPHNMKEYLRIYQCN